MKHLKVFISYSSDDKKLARLFKSCFITYAGFLVFLAHEDIVPASEWELKIIEELKQADIVVPLITNNYHSSEFTDQELGMAFAWDKIIIPIKLTDINPYGFIKKIQALKCLDNEYDVINAVLSIVFVLIERKEYKRFKKTVVDCLINAFNSSGSFKTTRIIIRILTKIDQFNSNQITSLKKAIKNNNQIYDEYYALPDFKKMLEEKHKIAIDT